MFENYSKLKTLPPHTWSNFFINFLDELDHDKHFIKFPFKKKKKRRNEPPDGKNHLFF